MNSILKKVYLNAPFVMKRAFANIEATRRNIYRRSGRYQDHYNELDVSKMLINYNRKDQVIKLNTLLTYIKEHIPFYQENLKTYNIKTLNEMENIPLTSKNIMKNDINHFIDNNMVKKLWNGTTSGSTGMPFSYFRDKNSMQFEYALYDKMYEFLVGIENFTKARLSGVNVVKANATKPPFWYFIKVYNQLQLSAYHIDENTSELYLNALRNYQVDLGTGYASSWLFLAQYTQDMGFIPPNLKVIVTDSEGFSKEDKLKVENAFNCSVYQTYGLGEVGMVAIQCSNGHYHSFADRCIIEVIDDNGKLAKKGQEGEIVVTDLYSFNAPFIRYQTGDRGILGYSECGCGWKTTYIKELIGRIDDYVLTLSGRKIGRLSHIAKPARGVVGMQLIQYKPGYLDIKVKPANDFVSDSMNEVLKVAKEYLGDMKITWELTDELEKTRSGKVRYVIRKF